jgi:hypothetical protein
MRTRLLVGATALCAIVASVLVGSVPSSAQSAMLPDLGMGAITGVRMDETTMPGHKLLRYDSRIVNVGTGPFEVSGTRASTSDTLMSVTQRIYDDAGTFTDVAIPGASMYWAGDGHNHWHLTDLEDGVVTRVTGTKVLGSLAKHGFHMIDDEPYNLTLPGAPQTAYYDSFRTADSRNPNALSVMMGLSVGWQDNYQANTNLQWIDVTGLRAGKYKMTVTADGQGWFEESNLSNNSAWAIVKIAAHRITVLEQGPGA